MPKSICVVDAQPFPDLVQSGTFDLDGMLAALESQRRRMGAKRIPPRALVITGQTSKIMARQLGGSFRTIEIHRRRMMKKMGAASLADLVRITLAADAARS